MYSTLISGIEIMGVVKNFHFMSLREEIEPQVFILHLGFAKPTLIMARIEAGKETETLERVNEFYKVYNPGFPLDYTFLDDEYQSQYTSEQRVSTLARYFAVLTIIISCLGLFGLAAFTVQRRMKEIGIRKICGSTDFGIVRLLAVDFNQIMVLAIAISLLVSYFFARKWLDGFAYRIGIEWWIFVGSSVLVLLIAWLTIGLQTLKAATVNPAQCIQDE
jgi:putative ABC transport system permease protein